MTPEQERNYTRVKELENIARQCIGLSGVLDVESIIKLSNYDDNFRANLVRVIRDTQQMYRDEIEAI